MGEVNRKATGGAERPRNGKGRWPTGVSGNPQGRPRKRVEAPKSVAEAIADAMSETVPFTDLDGRTVTIPANEAFARQLVHSFSAMKPRDLIFVMRWMEEVGAHDAALKRRGHSLQGRTLEQARELIKARMQELREEGRLGPAT